MLEPHWQKVSLDQVATTFEDAHHRGFPVILTMRTWAVWNRDRRMAIGLLAFFAICWVPCIPVVIIYNNSLRCETTVHYHALLAS
jgi:hypothetical protein